VTYKGRPLYVYSLEKFTAIAGSLLMTAGTAGNGNGLPGPGGGTFSDIPVA
jgi:hypothetical protein